MSVLVSWVELESVPALQNLYPTNDIASGTWATTPYWSKLNSEDTLTFITSTGTAYMEVALDNPASVGAGFTAIEIVARKSGSAVSTLNVVLVEGTTVRASRTVTLLATSFTLYTLELTAPEIASIVDWNNLRVRISHPESS